MEESDMSPTSMENPGLTTDETKSDNSEAYPVSSASDANNRTSSFEVESSSMKQEDDSSLSFSLNNEPSAENCPDNASDIERPSSAIDNDDRSNDNSMEYSPLSSVSSNCCFDEEYYASDEDIERFCEQEIITSKGNNSGMEDLKIEGNFLESLASTSNETATPAAEIVPQRTEPAENPFISSSMFPAASIEHYLLIQCMIFFANNPIVGEVVDRNELVTSRYFTDEFALQHGLTVNVNEVAIRDALEHDTMTEDSSDQDSFDPEEEFDCILS